MDCLWRGWPVARGRERPDGIVMGPPCLDHHTHVGQGVEHLAVQKVVAALRVGALAVACLGKTVRWTVSRSSKVPRTASLDESRLRAKGTDPVPHRLGDELRAVDHRVRTDGA